MSFERLFALANGFALLSWLPLVFLPRWRPAAGIVCPVIAVGLLSIAYALLIVPMIGAGEGDFSSLAGVQALFGNDRLLLAGWLHYLAFDLFIGSWEVRDARRNGVHHLLVIPCLFFTFMLGPVGLLMYLGIRAVKMRRVSVDESIA